MFRHALTVVQKWPDIAFTSLAGVLLSTGAMLATGGAPNAYEVREAQAALARLVGNEAHAAEIERRHVWVEAVHLIPASLPAVPGAAEPEIDLELALLGGDLLGGPLPGIPSAPRLQPLEMIRTVQVAAIAEEPQLIAAATHADGAGVDATPVTLTQ